MMRPIQLSCYCTTCGCQLEGDLSMSAKELNEARIDVAPCKMCEKNSTKKSIPDTDRAKVISPAEAIETPKKRRGRPPGGAVPNPPPEVPKKRRGRPPKNSTPEQKDIALVHKRRGRPPKHSAPDTTAIAPVHKKRGRPPKIKTVENE